MFEAIQMSELLYFSPFNWAGFSGVLKTLPHLFLSISSLDSFLPILPSTHQVHISEYFIVAGLISFGFFISPGRSPFSIMQSKAAGYPWQEKKKKGKQTILEFLIPFQGCYK
jgi:hypothetical protein